MSDGDEEDGHHKTLSSPQKRASWLMLSGLAGAVGALLFLSWLSEEVLEGEALRFDDSVRSLIHQYANDGITSLARGVTFLGSVLFILLAFGAAILAFLVVRWWRELTLLTVTMAGALLLDGVLKTSFHRARPVPFFDTPLPSSYSFPSGHALMSFCFYGVAALILTSRLKSQALRLTVWVAAALLVILIGWSRIYLGVHYPSDVLAGYAAALVWMTSVTFAARYFSGRRRKAGAGGQGKQAYEERRTTNQ